MQLPVRFHPRRPREPRKRSNPPRIFLQSFNLIHILTGGARHRRKSTWVDSPAPESFWSPGSSWLGSDSRQSDYDPFRHCPTQPPICWNSPPDCWMETYQRAGWNVMENKLREKSGYPGIRMMGQFLEEKKWNTVPNETSEDAYLVATIKFFPSFRWRRRRRHLFPSLGEAQNWWYGMPPKCVTVAFDGSNGSLFLYLVAGSEQVKLTVRTIKFFANLINRMSSFARSRYSRCYAGRYAGAEMNRILLGQWFSSGDELIY